jgi:hypothetical protein
MPADWTWHRDHQLVMIIFLEGFAWIRPDDPTSYNPIDQLTGNG